MLPSQLLVRPHMVVNLLSAVAAFLLLASIAGQISRFVFRP